MRPIVFVCALVGFFPASALGSMPISAPWTAGESWAGGTPGSYYSQDQHLGISEYAIDFNRYPSYTSDPGYPIVAVEDGKVAFVGVKTGFGNCVEIDHGSYNGKRVTSFYAHFKDGAPIVVSEQEAVKRGQVIGFCGKSGGTSSGEHLHFELREDGQSVEITDMDGYHWCTGCSGHPHPSQNTNLINVRKQAPLNDRNPYGWPQTPDQAFGDEASPPGALYEIGWYHGYDPDNLYAGDGTAKNCYRALYLNGPANAAIVYDALGGARFAYVVGWEKWEDWNDLPLTCGSCPNPAGGSVQYGEGGPNSCLGMPITNSYRAVPNEEIWRQDFQKGYIVNGEIYCYPYHAPGMTAGDIWDHQYSYLFAEVKS